MKITITGIICVVIAAVSGDQIGIPENVDCSCDGYKAQAYKCKWSNPQTCAGDEYNNFQTWCNKINNFRDKKRKGKVENNYLRKLTCDANKSFDQRVHEKCGLIEAKSKTMKSLPIGAVSLSAPAANSVNWTPQMTAIKNQGGCGSCWAFATVALCEWYLKNFKSEVILSDQYLVDCDYTNGGCGGGWPRKSLNFANQFGISNSSYKYNGVKGPKCLNETYAPVNKCPVHIQEYYPRGNDTRMRQILSHGPVLGAIAVNGGFMQYAGGLFTPVDCTGSINHAIVLVGFGNEPLTGKPAWKVRNSWGATWGDKTGHIWIDASTPNVCNLTSWMWYY